MAVCVNCGRELNTNDVFCPTCGAKNPDIVSAPETKEESIALAEKLISEYKALERATKELQDNQMRLATPVESVPKQHAAFKYFWPYMVYAAVTFGVFYIIGSVLAAISMSIAALAFISIGWISIPIFLITGGVKAVRTRNEMNSAEIENQRKRKEQQEIDRKNNEVLDRKRKKAQESVMAYDPIVPRELRNSASMNKVKALLQANKAENFAQAIEIIKS